MLDMIFFVVSVLLLLFIAIVSYKCWHELDNWDRAKFALISIVLGHSALWYLGFIYGV